MARLREKLKNVLEAQEICPHCGRKVHVAQFHCQACHRNVNWVDMKVGKIIDAVPRFLTEVFWGERDG